MSNFELNEGDDGQIAIDISGSMREKDVPGGVTRYEYAVARAEEFAYEAAKHDKDGVSVFQFGEKVYEFPDLKSDELGARLRTAKFEMKTNTHLVVRAGYAEHKARGNKQTVLMIFTDGEPSDEEALFAEIVKITNDVKDEREFNISILTVGKRSTSLQAHLTKLDDGIPGAKYDIVDVKEAYEVDFTQAFAGALED